MIGRCGIGITGVKAIASAITTTKTLKAVFLGKTQRSKY